MDLGDCLLIGICLDYLDFGDCLELSEQMSSETVN